MRGLRIWLVLVVAGAVLQGCRGSASQEQASGQSVLEIVRSAVPLTSGEPALHNPAWAPRGDLIAASGVDDNSLWVLGVDSLPPRQVVSGQNVGGAFTWCVDGRCLAFRQAEYHGRRRLWKVRVLHVRSSLIYDVAGPAPRVSPPRWDPPSKTLYFTERGNPRLFRLAMTDTGLVSEPLTLKAWAEQSEAGTLVFEKGAGLEVYTAGKTAPVRCALPGEAQILNPAVSPNGKLVAFESTSGDSLFVFDLVTGRTRPLGVGHAPVWSPLGDYLACVVLREDGLRLLSSDLVLVDSRSGERLQVTDTPDRLEGHPSWAPDGERLVYHEQRDGKLYLAEFKHVYATPPER